MPILSSFRIWREKRRRDRKFKRRQKWSEGLTVEQTFSRIYAENKWGKPKDGGRFYSGDGSLPEFSAAYEDFLADRINAMADVKTIVDIGCGDFQVGRRLLAKIKTPVTYIGCDVAAELVDHHNAHFRSDRVSFRQLNAIEDELPAGDVVTVRQVLQHLSNAQVQKVIAKLAPYRLAAITESLPVNAVQPNLDIAHGIAVRIPLGSGIYVDQPPFSLTVAEARDFAYSQKEFIRTSLIVRS